MELDELDKRLGEILDKFPQKRRELVENVGEKMYQQVLRNIDSCVKEGTGDLKRGVSKEIGSRGGYAAIRANYKIAPHANLVENGHKIVRGGKVVGWVAGKHMYRNTINQVENEIIQEAEEMLEKLVGDCFD